MAGPAKRTVTGTYLNADGSPKYGYLEFTPNTEILKQGEAIIPLDTVTAYLQEDGTFQCELFVTDDIAWQPNGWAWNIEEKLENGRVWWFFVPTGTEPLDISNLYNPDAAPPYIPVQSGKGDQGIPGPPGPPGPGVNVTRGQNPPLDPIEGDIWIKDFPASTDVAPADILTNAALWGWAGFGYESGISIVAASGGMRITWDGSKAAQFPGMFMPLVSGTYYRLEVDLEVASDSGPVFIAQYLVNGTDSIAPGTSGHLVLDVPFQSPQSSWLGVVCDLIAPSGGSVLVTGFHVWQPSSPPVSYIWDEGNGWTRLSAATLDQITADGLYVNATGDTVNGLLTVINASLAQYGLVVDRNVISTSTSDKEIFVVKYRGVRATWTNEKGQLRTTNDIAGATGEDAFKIIGSAVGNYLVVTDTPGNNIWRIGPLGRVNFYKGLRMVGDTMQIRDATEVDESTISQPINSDMLIVPKRNLSVSNKKIANLAPGTLSTDAINLQQLLDVTMYTESDIVESNGWIHYGSTFGNAKVSRFGKMVVLQGMMKRTSDLVASSGGWNLVGVVPLGFRPDVAVYGVGTAQYSAGSAAYHLRTSVSASDGSFQIAVIPGGTFSTGHWVGFNMSWRAA